MSKLKLCPFATTSTPHDLIAMGDGQGSVWIECMDCGARGPKTRSSGAEAVAAWNRRASPQAKRDDVLAAARRMLGSIEPDGPYAVDGYYKDAALVASAMLAASKETER